MLTICGQLLETEKSNWPDGTTRAAQTPRIVFEDRDNCLFAITAAPRPNRTWKDDLLAGRADPAVAAACGRLLGTLHGASWHDADIARRVGDRTLFEELRVAPYYRTLATARDDAREPLERLIDSLAQELARAGACRFQSQELAIV